MKLAVALHRLGLVSGAEQDVVLGAKGLFIYSSGGEVGGAAILSFPQVHGEASRNCKLNPARLTLVKTKDSRH